MCCLHLARQLRSSSRPGVGGGHQPFSIRDRRGLSSQWRDSPPQPRRVLEGNTGRSVTPAITLYGGRRQMTCKNFGKRAECQLVSTVTAGTAVNLFTLSNTPYLRAGDQTVFWSGSPLESSNTARDRPGRETIVLSREFGPIGSFSNPVQSQITMGYTYFQ
jgi:hypothetical protein